MGRACGMNREKRNSVVIRKSKEHLEDQGVSGSIILKWILKETGWEVWTGFFSNQDKDLMWDVQNMVMYFWVPYNPRYF